MTIALRAAGTPTGAADAVTAVNPAVPAGAVVGDLSVLTVVAKPFSTTITTPANWTKIGEHTNGTTASGTDVGSTKVAVYVRENAPTGAIGAIGQSGANTMGAVINVYSKTKSSWDFTQFTQGFDATVGANYSATGDAGIAVAAGDWVVASTAINGDIGTVTVPDIAGMSGATIGTDVQRTNSAVTTGNDCRTLVSDAPITAGSSSAAPTFAYTNASSTSGTTIWLRLREVNASVVVREIFTTGADNDTITAANTGSTAVVLTGGTAVIDTGVVWSATRAVLMDGTSTSGGVYWQVSIPQSEVLAADIYVLYNALPNTPEPAILGWYNGATRQISLTCVDTGQIRLRDGASTNIWTSTAQMVTGQWYRISLYATQHASTGTVRAAMFEGASATPLDDSTLLTGRNTGASPYNSLRFGLKGGTGTNTVNGSLDDYAYDRGASGLIPPEAPPPITATPTAIASAEAFGTAVANVQITAAPGGIGSAEAFGTPVAGGLLTATPTAIGTAEAFGTPEATIAAGAPVPTGIPSAEALGTPSMSGLLTATPTGIPSAETFGTAVANVRITATPSSIGAGETFGTPAAGSILTAVPAAVPSGEAFGSPVAGGHLTVSPAGVVSGEQFGTPSAGGLLVATPTGIPSGEAVGTPQLVTAGISTPNSIPSAETFGTPSVALAITATPGTVGSLEAFGSPVVNVQITAAPTGIASGQAVGTPTVTGMLVVTVAGIPSAEAFGVPAMTVNMVYLLIGVASAEAFGTPIMTMLYDFAVTGARLTVFDAEPTAGFKVTGATLTDWRADE